MAQMQRAGVSLEKKLLTQFDQLIAKQGYPNRSEAIRDLIRDRLSAQKLGDPKVVTMAAVVVVYDHHESKLAQRLTAMQHSHLLDVISTLHVHVDHHTCMEIIVLRGKVRDITRLSDKIVSLKGVKLGKVNLIAAE